MERMLKLWGHLRRERGITVVEYAILIALIAAVIIAVAALMSADAVPLRAR